MPYNIKNLLHAQPGEKIQAVWRNGSYASQRSRVLEVKGVDKNKVLHCEGGLVFSLKSESFDSIYDNTIHMKKYTIQFFHA